jgi:lipopolysaccharide transport system permease protein
MYATPVAYPISAIPEKYKYIILYNPLTPIITGFRYSLLNSGTFNIHLTINSLLIISIGLFFGILIFSRVEKSFIDTV